MEDDKDKEFKVFFAQCKYTMRNEKVEKGGRWVFGGWKCTTETAKINRIKKYIFCVEKNNKKRKISDRQQAVYIIVIYCIHSLRLYIFH